MIGREEKKSNDLFFVCSLIEYIARKTKNPKAVIVATLGPQKIQHIIDLADVYHSENIENLTDELIIEKNITQGHYDTIGSCLYSVPSHWDIGKVYKRLLLALEHETDASMVDLIFEVYNSPITQKLDNLNSSMYYENPAYIFESYKLGSPCED